MRWRRINPRSGDKRTINKFLFLPLTVNGITIWLEFVCITQKYEEDEYEEEEIDGVMVRQPKMMAVSRERCVPILTKAIQQMDIKIIDVDDEVTILKKRVVDLENQLTLN